MSERRGKERVSVWMKEGGGEWMEDAGVRGECICFQWPLWCLGSLCQSLLRELITGTVCYHSDHRHGGALQRRQLRAQDR